MRQLNNKVKARINNYDNGEVFTISDFTDIAQEKTISKFLERLAKKGKIEKIMRGVYWKKDESGSPQVDKIAYAIARANDWEIAPSGDSAIYLYGLTDKEPNNWEFVSNGSCRKYKIGNKLISIKHTTGKLLSGLSKKTVLLIQVIKAYGKDKLPTKLIEKMMAYTKEEKDKIVSETKKTTAWIVSTISSIYKKEEEHRYE